MKDKTYKVAKSNYDLVTFSQIFLKFTKKNDSLTFMTYANI